MRGIKATLICLFGTILCHSASVSAVTAFHSLSDINAAAKQHINERLSKMYEEFTVTLTPLDNRLKLTPCDTPLEAFTPPGAKSHGNTTVGVKCAGPKPWSIYVPARVAAFANVFVFTSALPARTPISEEHLQMQKVDVSTTYFGTYNALQDIVGYETRYPVRAYEVVSSNKIQMPKLVKTGESVTIISKFKGIAVRASGTALTDGVKGDRIRVRNHSSKRIIEGYIDSPSTVVINY